MSRLRVTIDSNANIKSENTDVIEFSDLDVTEEQWDELSEEDKFALVIEYWHSQGIPEITFEKVED